jgi:tetratricopeptide (TPR) repeat protein
MKKHILSYVVLLSLFLTAALPASANQSLSPKTYKALNDIQALLGEGNYVEVEEELLELEDDLSPGFGLALSYQIHAQLYLAQENTSQAIIYFNKALELEAMKAVQTVSLATNLSQLYLSDGATKAAIDVLQPRIEASEIEKKNSTMAMAYITLGSAHQVNGDFASSIPWLKEGIKRSKKPRENWLQMLMAAHYQLKQYPQAIELLSQLIVINESKEEYWLQKASLYQIQQKPKKSLEVLELAYVRGVLKKEDGLILLVQLLVTQGIPERGGRLLHEMLQQNLVELSESNWGLLASAWIQGRERVSAIMALENAALLSEKELGEEKPSNKQASSKKIESGKARAAKLYYRAAQLQFDEDQFAASITNYQKSLSLGLSGKKVGTALLMQGNSYFELGSYKDAKLYFSKALAEPSSNNSARAWLDYMQQLELFE